MRKFSILLILAIAIVSCSNSPKGTKVTIHTTMGDIVAVLYDETPQHRDNFIKLAKSHYYDSLLFHRVIDGFMIQGGDPTSKNAPAGQMLGRGEPGYTIPAEIVYPKFYHKKGALAAARQSDQINPDRQSSGSQFYIVQGTVLSEGELAEMEKGMLQQMKQDAGGKVFRPYVDSLRFYQSVGDSIKFMTLYQKAASEANKAAEGVTSFRMDPNLRTVYKSIGGTPFLDGTYTVFGEVIEGLDVVDKIAKVPVDGNSRPLTNVVMSIEVDD